MKVIAKIYTEFDEKFGIIGYEISGAGFVINGTPDFDKYPLLINPFVPFDAEDLKVVPKAKKAQTPAKNEAGKEDQENS